MVWAHMYSRNTEHKALFLHLTSKPLQKGARFGPLQPSPPLRAAQVVPILSSNLRSSWPPKLLWGFPSLLGRTFFVFGLDGHFKPTESSIPFKVLSLGFTESDNVLYKLSLPILAFLDTVLIP